MYNDSIIAYNEAIEINPNYADAYINKGSALFAQKKVDEAIKEYDEAIKINSNHADAYSNKGNAISA
jgi:protein O-GlcNAc transferase